VRALGESDREDERAERYASAGGSNPTDESGAMRQS
jgi:hypothetical protein